MCCSQTRAQPPPPPRSLRCSQAHLLTGSCCPCPSPSSSRPLGHILISFPPRLPTSHRGLLYWCPRARVPCLLWSGEPVTSRGLLTGILGGKTFPCCLCSGSQMLSYYNPLNIFLTPFLQPYQSFPCIRPHGFGVRNRGLGARPADSDSGSPLARCVTLGKSLNLSEPDFPHL